MVIEQRAKDSFVEDIDAHRCEIRSPGRLHVGTNRALLTAQVVPAGLLVKFRDDVFVVRLQDAEAWSLGGRYGDGGYRNPGICLLVMGEHLAIVHRVQLVSRQNQHVVVSIARKVEHALPNRVSGALKPVLRHRCLLGREDVDKAIPEPVELVRSCDMPVEAGRVELCQNEDPVDVRVDTVRYRDVDEPVLPGDRHGRL